jgi:hypothetical protein
MQESKLKIALFCGIFFTIYRERVESIVDHFAPIIIFFLIDLTPFVFYFVGVFLMDSENFV